MNKAVINIKTDTKTKQEAKKLADEFGVSLSSLITMSLRNLIRTKRIDISLIPEDPATADEIASIKKGLVEYKTGRVISLQSL